MEDFTAQSRIPRAKRGLEFGFQMGRSDPLIKGAVNAALAKLPEMAAL
jgi:hypothetical protein